MRAAKKAKKAERLAKGKYQTKLQGAQRRDAQAQDTPAGRLIAKILYTSRLCSTAAPMKEANSGAARTAATSARDGTARR